MRILLWEYVFNSFNHTFKLLKEAADVTSKINNAPIDPL